MRVLETAAAAARRHATGCTGLLVVTVLAGCAADSAGCDTSNPLMPRCPEVRTDPAGPEPRLVFVSNRDGPQEIFTMNSDGTGARRLTVNTGTDQAPVWSPDGSRILWMSVRPGSPARELWTMNADGSDQRRLTNLGNNPGFAHWSPDGTRIAFNADRGDGNFDVYTMAADGSDVRRLTTTNSQVRPRWSPDGTRLVVQWYQTTGPGTCCSRIGIMNADGTGFRVLALPTQQDFQPSWSPDGRQIVFRAFLPVGEGGNMMSTIAIVNEDGTGLRPLGTATMTGRFPAWSRSDNRIYFISELHGGDNIHSIRPDGSGLRRLTASTVGTLNFQVEPR